MIVRKLNDLGMEEFSHFINNLRNGGKQNTPIGMLASDETSDAMDFELELGDIIFLNRYELGVYLTKNLGSIETQLFMGDAGFWSALALYWFDQLCPVKQDGSRKPAMMYNYVLSENYNHRPRHAIFTTWQLVSRYGEVARFLLSRELPVRGELIEQLMARQYYLGCEGVMRAASKLYYDPARETFGKGSAGRTSPGCAYRFISWLQQLEVNYDLFTMTEEDLLSILPPEFNKFLVAN
ncbi:MAG: hypothetical protein ACE5FQ_01375 [Thiogranum sp.]